MEEIEIKDKILKGALDLFKKYGIRSVSMDDIARHLSISKKTIYQYFVDKEDMVVQVAKDHIEQSKTKFDETVQHSRNAIDELILISVLLKKEVESMNPSMLFDLHKYHTTGWNVWLDHKNHYIRSSVVRNLRQGIEEGYYRPEIDPEVMASVRIEQVELCFDERVFPNPAFNLLEVQSQVFEHFIFGLLTDKGRKLYEKYKQEQLTTEPIYQVKL
jgi:TetR/AcrR family transcriptional regulator, cholesterol catabolism regulator